MKHFGLLTVRFLGEPGDHFPLELAVLLSHASVTRWSFQALSEAKDLLRLPPVTPDGLHGIAEGDAVGQTPQKREPSAAPDQGQTNPPSAPHQPLS